MKVKITSTLKKMGVPQHVYGWDYLVYAIELYTKDRNIIHAVTKELYPAIAIKFKTTPIRVERSIRHAIETSMSAVTPDVIEEVFGNSIPLHKDKPCNSQYIATVARLMIDD